MLKNKLSVLAIVAGALVSSQAVFAAEQKADQKFIDDSSYAVGVLMGKNIEGVVESQKEIFSYNQDKILAGVQDTIKKTGKLTDEDLQKQLKSLDTYLASQESKIAAEKSKATVEAGNKFRAEYEKQSGVKKTASGLLYKIEKAGTGELANSPLTLCSTALRGILIDVKQSIDGRSIRRESARDEQKCARALQGRKRGKGKEAHDNAHREITKKL